MSDPQAVEIDSLPFMRQPLKYPFVIAATEDNCLNIGDLKVPKCMTPLGGKLYFVDIGGKALREYNPKTRTARTMKRDGGPEEFTTALGVNQDGSLIVACQSGVYMVKTDGGNDHWEKLCDLNLADNERPNNGVMIPCSDGKTRFFLGTAAIDPELVRPVSIDTEANGLLGKTVTLPDMKTKVLPKPGRLLVLEQEKDGRFVSKELFTGAMTVNGLSGQSLPSGEIVMTFSDSNKDASILKTAHYRPHISRLDNVQTCVNFRGNEKEAKHGRPDGTSPVLYNGEPSVAVAAIDSNEVHIYPIGKGEQRFGWPSAKIVLPDTIKKPTMATFVTEDDRTVCYVTAFDNSSGQNEGKIFRIDRPEMQAFTPINHVGSYAGLEELRAATAHVSSKKGGAAQVM